MRSYQICWVIGHLRVLLLFYHLAIMFDCGATIICYFERNLGRGQYCSVSGIGMEMVTSSTLIP